jgi:hypothetical protein
MSQKMMSVLLHVFFTCLAFVGLSILTFPLAGLLVYLRVITINLALATRDHPAQEDCMDGDDLTKNLTDVVGLLLLISCQKSHQSDIRLQIKDVKSVNPPNCLKLCTRTPKICPNNYLPSNCASTLSVQTGTPYG